MEFTTRNESQLEWVYIQQKKKPQASTRKNQLNIKSIKKETIKTLLDRNENRNEKCRLHCLESKRNQRDKTGI